MNSEQIKDSLVFTETDKGEYIEITATFKVRACERISKRRYIMKHVVMKSLSLKIINFIFKDFRDQLWDFMRTLDLLNLDPANSAIRHIQEKLDKIIRSIT